MSEGISFNQIYMLVASCRFFCDSRPGVKNAVGTELSLCILPNCGMSSLSKYDSLLCFLFLNLDSKYNILVQLSISHTVSFSSKGRSVTRVLEHLFQLLSNSAVIDCILLCFMLCFIFFFMFLICVLPFGGLLSFLKRNRNKNVMVW